MIPTGIGPEGIRAIPERGLLAVSAETDALADDVPIRSIVRLLPRAGVPVRDRRPNLLVRLSSSGAVVESVPLPPGVVANATSSGFEGVG